MERTCFSGHHTTRVDQHEKELALSHRSGSFAKLSKVTCHRIRKTRKYSFIEPFLGISHDKRRVG